MILRKGKPLFDQAEKLLKQGDYYRAVEQYLLVLPHARDQHLGTVLARLADCLRNTGDYKQAEEYARQAIQTDSSFSAFHGVLGIILAETERFEESLQCFAQAQRLSLTSPADYSIKMSIICEELGDHTTAVKHAKEAFDYAAFQNDPHIIESAKKCLAEALKSATWQCDPEEIKQACGGEIPKLDTWDNDDDGFGLVMA